MERRLRFERRYADILRRLDAIASDSMRVRVGAGGLVGLPPYYGVGDRPVAEFRGWAHLLLGDKASAAADGRAVLAFMARQQDTERNRWFLRLLAAEGHTFAGRSDRAIAAAREALELMPPSRQVVTAMNVSAAAARVFAWSGAHDEAVRILDELATASPGLGPAEIPVIPCCRPHRVVAHEVHYVKPWQRTQSSSFRRRCVGLRARSRLHSIA